MQPRRLLALAAVVVVAALVVYGEFRTQVTTTERLRREVDSLVVREIVGDPPEQRWAATVLAARAKVAIRALRQHAAAGGEQASTSRQLLAEIAEELR